MNIEQYFGDMRKHFVPTTSKAQFFELPKGVEETKQESVKDDSEDKLPPQTA